MPRDGDGRALQEVIEAERTAYLEGLPEPQPNWPPDVRVVYRTVVDQLFDWGGVEAQEVLEECGIGSHDIYSRFRFCTGHGIKVFVIHHRLGLAKCLLSDERLSVTQIAIAVGYSSCGGFSATFRRRVGETPTKWREGGEG